MPKTEQPKPSPRIAVHLIESASKLAELQLPQQTQYLPATSNSLLPVESQVRNAHLVAYSPTQELLALLHCYFSLHEPLVHTTATHLTSEETKMLANLGISTHASRQALGSDISSWFMLIRYRQQLGGKLTEKAISSYLRSADFELYFGEFTKELRILATMTRDWVLTKFLLSQTPLSESYRRSSLRHEFDHLEVFLTVWPGADPLAFLAKLLITLNNEAKYNSAFVRSPFFVKYYALTQFFIFFHTMLEKSAILAEIELGNPKRGFEIDISALLERCVQTIAKFSDKDRFQRVIEKPNFVGYLIEDIRLLAFLHILLDLSVTDFARPLDPAHCVHVLSQMLYLQGSQITEEQWTTQKKAATRSLQMLFAELKVLANQFYADWSQSEFAHITLPSLELLETT